MYQEYFDLKEQPYSISPDPRFIYLTRQHEEAAAKCEYAISQKMGLSAIYGDIGTGKTSLARRLLQQFADDPAYNFAILVHHNCRTPFQLIKEIRREFGRNRPRRSLPDELNDFRHFLINQHTAGKTTVLVVDEAQDLKPPLFEVLRQLLNFETDTEKLLQIVLFGQNELAVKLDRLPAFKDRVTIFGALSSLTKAETDALIDFRWQVAGGALPHPFSEESLDLIFRHSGGRPRQLCKICDQALIRAFSAQERQVGPDVIEQVIQDIRVADDQQSPATATKSKQPPSNPEAVPELAAA